MDPMDRLLYLMEERKQMIEKLLEMNQDLMTLHRDLQVKYLTLLLVTKVTEKPE